MYLNGRSPIGGEPFPGMRGLWGPCELSLPLGGDELPEEVEEIEVEAAREEPEDEE